MSGTLNITRQELIGTFDYIEWDAQSQDCCDSVKEILEELEITLLTKLKLSRERSLAMTNIEQAFMWVGKAIRADQLKRNSEDV